MEKVSKKPAVKKKKPTRVKKSWLARSLAQLKSTLKKTPPKLRKIGGIGLSVLLVAVVSIIVIKKISLSHDRQKLEAEAKAGPKVRVTEVKKSEGDHTVMVTGETVPFATVTLYAKVSGYLGKILVDKGDVVKKGQVLANIDSPETDQDFFAAKSDFVNRQDIANRMYPLIKKDLISPQEYEQVRSEADMAHSRFLAAQTLKNYETLAAPFAGTITARYVDPGVLIQSASNGQSGALPVITLSQINALRTYVYLDQRDANFVQVDTPVKITLAERPGFEIQAKINRLAGELDPKTRMMMAEIDIDNSNHEIVAGSFVTAWIPVHAPSMLQAPVDVLVNLESKTMVPVLKPDKTITYQEVKVGSNDGKNVSFISGVEAGQVLAMDLGANVPEGASVRPQYPEQQAQKSEDQGKDRKGKNQGSGNAQNNGSTSGSTQNQGDGSASAASSPKSVGTGGSFPAGDSKLKSGSSQP